MIALANYAVVSSRVPWDYRIISVSHALLCRLCVITCTIRLSPLTTFDPENKVCQQGPNVGSKNIVLPVLEAGSKFVTQFGVVEVVKDDRAVPTGTTSQLPKKGTRKYAAARIPWEAKNAKIHEEIAKILRIRKKRIDSLFESGNLRKDSMFYAYYGGDPKEKKISATALPKLNEIPKDPTHLEESFPDRIVECRLCPDLRKRSVSNQLNPSGLLQNCDSASANVKPMTLFLQRKLLAQEYREEATNYVCQKCGKDFASQPGVTYHIKSDACGQKNATKRERREERENRIEQSATKMMLVGIEVESRPRVHKKRSKASNQSKWERKKKRRERGIYAEAVLSLGFKLVKADMDLSEYPVLSKSDEPALFDNGMVWRNDEYAMADDEAAGIQFHAPETILGTLRKKLEEERRLLALKDADLKHGPMYKTVFQSLGYKKPRKRGIAAIQARVSKRQRKSTQEPAPLPPIIDTRALADEVDAGRYPSIKRNKDQEHADFCILCKDGGELICCDFCTNTEHLFCIRTKFTVKDPEPEDDFMCHRCIQSVLGKRSRAEKRRLEKQKNDRLRQRQQLIEDSKRNPGLQRGMEYPYMAARGQEVSEILILMQDARKRLEQSMGTLKMNNVRRRVMGLTVSTAPNQTKEL